jgi:ATP-dependent DNA helicase RecG
LYIYGEANNQKQLVKCLETCCDNVSSESLLKGIGSRPYNPLIAGAFFRSGQIGAWGRGIEKMEMGCAADDLPEPEFGVRPTGFSICFHIRNNDKAMTEDKIYSANGSGINSGINDVRQRIINLMLVNPSIKKQMIADELQINRRNIESHIRELKKIGAVEYVGARKNGSWVVK